MTYIVVGVDELHDHVTGELMRTAFCALLDIDPLENPWPRHRLYTFEEWSAGQRRLIAETGEAPWWFTRGSVEKMTGKFRQASRRLLLDMDEDDRAYWLSRLGQVENGCLLSAEQPFFSMD